MDPISVPYVDDAMSPLVNSKGNIADLNKRIQEKAQKAYEKAMRKGDIPLHSRLRVPIGGATQGFVTVPGYSTFDMRAAGLTSARGEGLIKARGAYKYPLNYKLDKNLRNKLKNMYLKSSGSGKALSYKKAYNKLIGKKYGSGAVYRTGGRLTRWPDETPDSYAERLAKHKKLLKAMYYYMKKLNMDGGKRYKGKQFYRDKLREVKDMIKEADPEYKFKRKSKKAMTPFESIGRTGLFTEPEVTEQPPSSETATVPASGMYYKYPRPLKGSGGFLGALLSAAAPMIMEGVNWIGKKIGQHFVKKGTGAFSEFSAKYPKSTGYSKKENRPAGKYYFWWKVYKLVRKEVPLFFPTRQDADQLAQEFVDAHKSMFMSDLLDRVSSHIEQERLTTGAVAEPLIEAIARTEGAPPEIAREISSLPGSGYTLDSSLMDNIVSMVSDPQVRSGLSQAAQSILPKVVKGIKSFAKGRFMKFLSRHPKLQRIASAVMKEDTPFTKQMPATNVIATGVSADSTNPNSLLAPTVYQLARN